ncbi:MAG: HAD-IA family hydrolase [Ilumatobacteraceae bacterium]
MSPTTPTTVAARPAAVLWDMDGTLVDTEPYWIECEHELVAEFGDQWTDEDARSLIGFDLLDAAAVLRQRGGVRLDPIDIVEWLQTGVIARVRERIPWRAGARELLSELNEQDVPCALVTMSWQPLAEAVVAALAPLRFQAIVTGDAVANGKPHPEPYLRAADLLGVDAEQCVAIEDSPTGVTSAGAAGCVVVVVPNLVDIGPAPGRYIVASLRDLTSARLGALVAAMPAFAELDGAPAVVADPTQFPSAERDDRRRRSGPIGVTVMLVAVAIVIRVVLRRGGDERSTPGVASTTHLRPAERHRRQRSSGRIGVAVVLVAVAIAVLVVLRSGGDDRAAPGPPLAFDVHAWAPYWAIDDALPMLETRANALSEVSPLWFTATGVDTIASDPLAPADASQQFIETARDSGIPVVPSIFDRTDAGVMAAILADHDQRARHLDTIVAFAEDGDYDGIDLDYEQFAFADGRDTWATTRPNWVTFVGELSSRLHADGRTLTVSIPPVYDAGQTDDSGYWVYDYAAIAPLVDTIRVMAYDYSNADTDAGAVAPLDWVDRVLAGTVEASGDPSKLVLGVPLYGYNWVLETAGTCPAGAEGTTTVTDSSVGELAQRRGGVPEYDPATGEWSFRYELVVDDGTTSCTQLRQVNYVGADGAQLRMQRAVDAGVRGVALFALGYAGDPLWTAVDTIAAEVFAASTPTSEP